MAWRRARMVLLSAQDMPVVKVAQTIFLSGAARGRAPARPGCWSARAPESYSATSGTRERLQS